MCKMQPADQTSEWGFQGHGVYHGICIPIGCIYIWDYDVYYSPIIPWVYWEHKGTIIYTLGILQGKRLVFMMI